MHDILEIRDLGVSDDIAKPAASGAEKLFDMLKRYSFSFYEVVSRIEQLRREARIYTGGMYTSAKEVHESTLDGFRAALADMRLECEKLDLISTTDLVAHVDSEVRLEGRTYTWSALCNHLDTLSFSFATELRRNSHFRISNDKDKYFEKNDLFGPEVSKAFASCSDEIRNAGNCYALEQPEASVFHSMRIFERGLGALATKFNVDFKHTNWHNVIEEVEKRIRRMDATFGADWKEKQMFYSQAATHFMFLKDAWRNHIMHIRDVPYDDGRAFSILDHARQFMQALAEGGLKE
jgi:hypothetical protein